MPSLISIGLLCRTGFATPSPLRGVTFQIALMKREQ
jgi:hypothetical protein